MEMIQNAYQGFAKQNYTMLDNLKLGYGGTKTEKERLIADAAKLSDTVDAQDMSFANIVKAINVVQTEMGITGTTAKEAASTIQGSVGMMKSSWANLVTGIADENANLDVLITNFVDSVGTVAQNIVPKIGVALSSASKLISDLIPVIVHEIPSLIEENLPILAEAAVGFVQSLVDGISENQEMLFDTVFDVITFLAESFIGLLPEIVELGLELIVSLANGIAESLPDLIPTIVDVILQIAETLIDNVDMLVDASIAIITGLVDGLIDALPEIANVAKGIIETLVNGIVENTPQLLSNGVKMLADFSSNLRTNLGTIVDAGIDTLLKFVDGIVKAMPDLIAYIPEIVSNIANIINDNAPKLVLEAAEIIQKLVLGLINNIPVIIQNLPKIISAIVDTILAFNWVNLGSSVIKGLGNGLKSMVSFVKNIGSQIVNAIKGGISNLPSQMIDIGKNIVSGLWSGIKSMVSWLGKQIKSFAGGIVSAAKNALGIKSPSRVFRDQIGKQMAAGIGVGWKDEFEKVKSDIEGSLSFDDASIGINASIRKVGEENFRHIYGDTSIGNVTINIDGAKYNNENSLAEAIADALQNMTDRRAAVYA